MRKFMRIGLVALAALGLTVSVTACGGGGSSSSSSGSGKSLVADTVFDLKTLDPARSFEFTGVTLDHQIYQTALNYADNGNTLNKVVPGLASYTLSSDAKTVTLKMKGTNYFSDGAKVTADDVAFSYERLIGIAGNPAFLLEDPNGDPIKVSQPDTSTVVLTSGVANPSLPFILPNPSLGIVEKKVVLAHGGTTDPNDQAGNWLTTHSAGSGPYVVKSADVKSQVKLAANPHYAGTKPAYSNVVVQNVTSATQKVNIQAGTSQMAFDLSADDAKSLNSGKTRVVTGQSTYTLYAWFNAQEKYGKEASNVKFVQAMRHAIDYSAIVKYMGSGSVQPGGVVPLMFGGSLKSDPNNSYDPAKAKQLLAESGYNGEEIDFLVSSDGTVGGVSIQSLGEQVQAQVKKLGVNLVLKPMPSVTALDTFRSGTFQAGLTDWGADYPDPADYIAFGPDQNVGKRAAWATGAGISSAERLKPMFTKAMTTADTSDRFKAWQDVQTEMNVDSPFIPVAQPGDRMVYSSSLSNVKLNPIWNVEFAQVK
jgi:peptide/nickel transport system substrate-binding protein